MSEVEEEPQEFDDDDVTVEDDESADVQAGADGTTPPYMSFTGFQSVLDKMVEHGPPDQVDRDFFGNASGSRVAQTMSALRFFGLVDDKKKPTQTLFDLVPPNTRKERMRKLIESHYPKAVALGSTKATQAQLDKVFPAKGGTLRKAVTFYLQAAEFTGIPLSPYFSKSRPSAGSGGSRRSNGTAKKSAPKKAAAPTGSEQSQSEASPLDLDEKKGKYIDLLLRLAEKKDGVPNEDVLDRLHTVLGYSEVKKTPRRRGSGTSDEGGENNG